MPMNEQETRFHLIDPRLREKGYDAHCWLKCETPAPVEPTGNRGSRHRGGGRTDYLLCVQAAGEPGPLPVAVLEAKAETADPLKGMQQARGYAECSRFDVHYVFSSNGYRYGEFDLDAQRPAGPFPMARFPSRDELTQRYEHAIGISLDQPGAAMLFQADSPAYNTYRYYQDAAIRAAFEKILRCEHTGAPARVLLSLATGAGKTVIAANLLWRLHEAGCLIKPALFLCDRDELRGQAYSKLSAVFGGAARIVKTVRDGNAAANAKVHIATYQTLGLDDAHDDVASFLSQHYADDAFSVIVIDECHRSAWGRWSEVLTRNPHAIQIGLTATPRKLEVPRRKGSAPTEDDAITANNIRHFGEPVYQYGLIQAQEDGYLAACEVVRLKPSNDWSTYSREDVLAMQPVDTRTGAPLTAEQLKHAYAANTFDDDILFPERIHAMCRDLFQRLCEHGGPEQKVIIFCTRDAHADRVALEMQRLYADWCQARGQTPKDKYAFKCTDSGGSDQIESMRGSGERCFIACTVDLLATGVDIERLNAVVFFRYLKSPITFYQMVGRGARIDEPTHKYKFWLYDYTGVTALFGTEFISKRRSPRKRTDSDDDGGDDGDPIVPPLPEAGKGEAVGIEDHGRSILQYRDGHDVLVPVEDYKRGMIERVLSEAASLAQFRDLWVHTAQRQDLIRHLLDAQFYPDTVRELMHMLPCDHYDLIAHWGYRARALTRHEREQQYLSSHADWFARMAPSAATVLRALGQQFGVGGTDAIESGQFWQVPAIRHVGGIDALVALGPPGDVMHDAKMRLFGV